MKILITGGVGLIGAHTASKLIELGHEVAVLDKKLNFIQNPTYFAYCLEIRQKYLKQPKVTFDIDIRDFDGVLQAFSTFGPDTVIHLAGLPMARVPDQYIHEMQPINMQGTLNVVRAFEESSSAKKIIYTSSSMAYGHFTKSPQPEDVLLSPINDYGACKAAGEYFVKLSKKEWVIVRPTSVYGFTDCANRVTQRIFDAALLNKKAWVVRGESLDISYIEDVADGFVLCTTKNSAVGQTFNISRGEAREASEFAEIVKTYFPTFEYEIREPTIQQVYRGALDIAKAKALLGYAPKFTIEDGIKDMISKMKKYHWKQPNN